MTFSVLKYCTHHCGRLPKLSADIMYVDKMSRLCSFASLRFQTQDLSLHLQNERQLPRQRDLQLYQRE